MTLATVAEVALLERIAAIDVFDRVAAAPDRSAVRLLRRIPAREAFGPRSDRVIALLERAVALSPADIEYLAAASRTSRHGEHYPEALLAQRQAAERSGRSSAAGLAADEAQRIVAGIVELRESDAAEDCVQWSIVGQQAAWGLADAARALVVDDLLAESQLHTLTRAWNAVR